MKQPLRITSFGIAVDNSTAEITVKFVVSIPPRHISQLLPVLHEAMDTLMLCRFVEIVPHNGDDN